MSEAATLPRRGLMSKFGHTGVKKKVETHRQDPFWPYDICTHERHEE